MNADTANAGSRIREVLREHASLVVAIDELGDTDDLFMAGMNSHSSVRVMFALEEAFGIEFPDEVLRRSTFASVTSIEAVISKLLQGT